MPDRDHNVPTCLEDALDWLRKNFDAEAARGFRAAYAFELTGARGGELTARVDDGRLELLAGCTAQPDLHLRLAAADFYGILAGRANPDLLFMRERIAWRGELSLALKLRRLFRGQPEEARVRRPGA